MNEDLNVSNSPSMTSLFFQTVKTKEVVWGQSKVPKFYYYHHETSGGWKATSKDLDISVSTVRGVIKRVTRPGTVKDLWGCENKSNWGKSPNVGVNHHMKDLKKITGTVWSSAFRTNYRGMMNGEWYLCALMERYFLHLIISNSTQTLNGWITANRNCAGGFWRTSALRIRHDTLNAAWREWGGDTVGPPSPEQRRGHVHVHDQQLAQPAAAWVKWTVKYRKGQMSPEKIWQIKSCRVKIIKKNQSLISTSYHLIINMWPEKKKKPN